MMTRRQSSIPAVKAAEENVSRTYMEFFAGIGLIHKALSPLGWTCVLANDNDPRKVATYAVNFPEAPLDSRDIATLDSSALPHAVLATASFPCIDLSQAGGRRGIEAEHSGVVWSFLEHIEKLGAEDRAPKYLLLENVAGLLTLHAGNSIDLLLHEIARLGYAFDLVQVDARHFTPQARNRVFIVAVRDQNLATGESMPEAHIRRYKVKEVFQRNRDLPWHFFDFPELPTRSIELADVLEDLPDGDPRWWSEDRLEYFWKHLERDHVTRLQHLVKSKTPLQFTATRRGRRRGLREQIFNLRNDGLASCLRTPKGGSSIQFVVRAGRGTVKVRRILAVESGRLQGVGLPGIEYQLPASEQDGLFGFGDAVCVPAVQWVVQNSIECHLNGRSSTGMSQLSLDLKDAV